MSKANYGEPDLNSEDKYYAQQVSKLKLFKKYLCCK